MTLEEQDGGNVLKEAAQCIHEGDLARARLLLEGELRAHPENAGALDLEAEILVRQGEMAVARELLEEYLRYYPDSDLAASRYAWLLWESGEKEEAIAEARATLARNPGNHRAVVWLLDWAAQLDNHGMVVEKAIEALVQWPDDPDILLALGRAQARLKQGPKATETLQRLLELYPDDEAAARFLAEVFLDDNLPQRALNCLTPFLARGLCEPETLLRGSEAAFRANQPKVAMEYIERLVTNNTITSESFLAEVHECLARNLGTSGTDKFTFGKLRNQELSDVYTVTLLESLGARDNRALINDVFEAIKDHPVRYPKAMARFLSTYHGAPTMPGTISRWVKNHQDQIERNVVLWGGVGAWMVAKSNWRGAVGHLSTWKGREGVKPWMLNLLAKAHEALGQIHDAMAVYRDALTLEPDHTEAAIRSKLAFNMALEGMAAAGQIILMGMREEAKKLGTVEDLIRIFAVQALCEADKIPDPNERRQLFQGAFDQMRQLARQDPYVNTRPLLRMFRERADQLIQLARMGDKEV